MRATLLALLLIPGVAFAEGPDAEPADEQTEATTDAPDTGDSPKDGDEPEAPDTAPAPGQGSSPTEPPAQTVPPPPDDATDKPLAVPGPARPVDDDPYARPRNVAPRASRASTVPRAPEPSEAAEPVKEPRTHYAHLDTGYRLLWFGNGYIPTPTNASGVVERPHMAHLGGGAMFPQNLYLGGYGEVVLNPSAGTLPFVGEVRIGWWDNAFGKPEQRGLFGRRGPNLNTLSGTAITYVGWRWVHDHYRGVGGAWAGTADAAGLVLGYARSAPFGVLTVTTDSQFSLYLAGWKNRSGFPLGLLNQRLSIGWDPIFLDVRFKADPATGNELSIGASMQGIF